MIAFWNVKRTELLKKLWMEGVMSAALIAAEIGGGCTRNMVIGKIQRLRKADPSLKERVTVFNAARLELSRARKSAVRGFTNSLAPKKARHGAVLVPPAGNPVGLTKRQHVGCCAIVGYWPEQLTAVVTHRLPVYCPGNAVEPPRRPYCAYHEGLYYNRTPGGKNVGNGHYRKGQRNQTPPAEPAE